MQSNEIEKVERLFVMMNELQEIFFLSGSAKRVLFPSHIQYV